MCAMLDQVSDAAGAPAALPIAPTGGLRAPGAAARPAKPLRGDGDFARLPLDINPGPRPMHDHAHLSRSYD
jgi:hypothetical protein